MYLTKVEEREKWSSSISMLNTSSITNWDQKTSLMLIDHKKSRHKCIKRYKEQQKCNNKLKFDGELEGTEESGDSRYLYCL